MRRTLAACAALLLAAAQASAQQPQAAPPALVASPDSSLQVALRVDTDGRPEYSVKRKDRMIVDWSRLGFILTDAPKLERGSRCRRGAARLMTPGNSPRGERRYVREHGNEMRATLRDSGGRELIVVFRVFDDGVGLRYEFPKQAALPEVNIVEELTEFAIAEPATAWWIPGGEWNRYEYLYNRTPLVELGQAHTPVTLKLAS